MLLKNYSDRLLGRRSSWDGVVVHNLADGRYYRVAHSHRDPVTGAWEIRWNPSDQVERPSSEPIYRFTGKTWDLPAYATSVFPWFALWLHIGAAVIFETVWLVAKVSPDTAGVIFWPFFLATISFFVSWFTKVEPVRSMKIQYTLAAIMAARSEQRRHEDALSRQQAAQARQTATQQILSNQQAIADRIGLILPDQHVTGWHG